MLISRVWLHVLATRYILIGGSSKEVRMYTKEGKFLQTVAKMNSWVWAVQPRPEWRQIVLGCDDGSLVSCVTNFSTVHGLHQDRYAHRDTMTDVILFFFDPFP